MDIDNCQGNNQIREKDDEAESEDEIIDIEVKDEQDDDNVLTEDSDGSDGENAYFKGTKCRGYLMSGFSATFVNFCSIFPPFCVFRDFKYVISM